MSQENIELVQTAYAEVNNADDPRMDGLHENIEIYDHDIMDSGDYRGHDGFTRWTADWASAWAEFTTEPEEFLDIGDQVVMTFSMKATGLTSGAPTERQDAIVFKVRDAKIVRIDYYNNRAQALQSVGLPE